MKSSQTFNLIIFGGPGDLSTRKLLPSLFNAYNDDNLNKESKIICIGRQDYTKEEFIDYVLSKFAEYHYEDINATTFATFANMIEYLGFDVTDANEYTQLQSVLLPDAVNIYYLSTGANLFLQICENLAINKLNIANSRIVLEKPLGHDRDSAREINQFVAKYFKEEQIYRIDHYLGKESVQNLMAIRFGNTLFEALWRRQWISNIQITISEQVGVEQRGDFYEKTGALRDMLQNHLLQLLCIVAMEPPATLDADTIRDEKLKVLKSLKPLTESDVLQTVVSGQYGQGIINKQYAQSYLEESHVAPDSMTETFVSLKAEIQNWRWAGVPFYLRTGKHLQERLAEIVIQFKDVPIKMFPLAEKGMANKLIISLQPEETVQLYFLAKQPGDTNELKPVYLDLNFEKVFASRKTDGYERLLLDIIRGKLTLFVRDDEQDAAWAWVMPILNTWQRLRVRPKEYNSGSWGPVASAVLLAKDRTQWHEED